MIEKDAGVQIASQIDLEYMACLLRVGHAAFLLLIDILPAAALVPARLGEHMLGRNAQRDRHDVHHISETRLGT